MNLPQDFKKNESGAVIVDWIVLFGIIAVLSILVMTAVGNMKQLPPATETTN